MATQWVALFSESGRNLRTSAVRELFKVVQKPGMISFGGGMPAPETFPCAEVSRACAKVLQEHGPVALQYGQTEGYGPLREYIAEVMMGELGLYARPDNVLITTGGLQAIDLLTKVLVDKGDAIVVEEPTFLGALSSFSAYCPQYISVPIDAQGMQIDPLEAILRSGSSPKFIYVMPNFHNPAGCTMSLERRQRLVQLADQHGVPLLEDDPYAQLRYSGEPLPPLIVLDQQQLGRPAGDRAFEAGNVVYVGSFSKILSPGMRLGWACGPTPIITRMAQAKQGVDLHTSLLIQMIAYELCRQGFFPGHITQIRALYGRRRDLMLSLMQEMFPPGVSWTEPEGGLFLWVTLPEGCDLPAILRDAAEKRVAFVPGQAFYAGAGGQNCFRLNFSNASEEQMTTGMTRLAEVLRERVGPAGPA